MATDHPGALPWWGGRHPGRADRLAQWTADQMPYLHTYAEPFAGMLGVLMVRRPSPIEIVNDLDSRLVVWWRVVRDHHTELVELIHNTPFSRAEWSRCGAEQWNPDLPDLERARCVTVAAWQAQRHPGNWPTTMRKARPRSRIIRNIAASADRIRNVRIEQRDALEVLAMLTPDPAAVIFADPPYRTDSQAARYYGATIDHHQLEHAIRDAKAHVVIAGDDGDHPQLEDWGWHKTTRRRITVGGEGAHDLAFTTDALWSNYLPAAQQLALEGWA